MTKDQVTTCRLQIPCDTKYVAMVRKSIKCIAESVGFSEVDCQDIEIAVAEAVSNSIKHGRPSSDCPGVVVRCRINPGMITIYVEDEGRIGYVPTPTFLPPDNQENGRGTILIRALMDKVSAKCTKQGLVLKMCKKNRKDASFGKDPNTPVHEPYQHVLLTL